MAIQFDRNVVQQPNSPVAQQLKPAPRVVQQLQDVAQHVAANGSPAGYDRDLEAVKAESERRYPITRAEFYAQIGALKAEVAALRELIARQAVAPAQKSRAEYYREYRKRPKGERPV